MLITYVECENDWLDIVCRQLTRHTKPYQVTFYDDNPNRMKIINENFVLKRIIEISSVSVVDSTLFNADSIKYLGNLDKIKEGDVHILMHYAWSNSLERLMYFTRFLAQVHANKTLPHCLILFVSDSDTPKYNGIHSLFEVLLDYAWSNKFLDFSIIELDLQYKYQQLHHLNPFYKSFNSSPLTSNVQIFPNKLSNANGYRFRMLGLTFTPFVNLTKENEVTGVHDSDMNFALILIAARFINFSVKYNHGADEHVGKSSLLDYLDSARRHFEADDIDALIQPLPIFDAMPDITTFIPVDYYFGKFVAIAPVSSISKLNSRHSTVLILMLAVFLIIASIMYIVVLLKITTNQMKIFDIISTVLGVVIPLQPRRTRDRIIFLSVILISFTYAFDFYSFIVGMKVEKINTVFQTFQEINQSGYQLYIEPKPYRICFTDNSDPYIQSIKSKVIQVSDDQICIDLLLKNRNVVCIMHHVNAQFLLDKYNTNDTKDSVMNMAKPVFSRLNMVYLFDKGSPYTFKFHDTFRRIYEYGIAQRFESIRKITFMPEPVNTNGKNTSILLTTLFLLLSIGFVLSMMIFALEFVISYFRTRK